MFDVFDWLKRLVRRWKRPDPDPGRYRLVVHFQCGACGRDHVWRGPIGPIEVTCACGKPIKLIASARRGR